MLPTTHAILISLISLIISFIITIKTKEDMGGFLIIHVFIAIVLTALHAIFI